ncbi:ArnT family glycosyltransferase [Thiovibrio frasassiensis]|uniref:Glycosyltransferase family 39 protein n=1 Tax=Thiovibrio frasassiensis TaxID=2984131 RepID=A0A9X4RLN7_9BACT|nr:glycosyltransferase family 39 protein [Thiovibrio frasassiensis]MDG4476301.1 glycosyltransferase family 39 protein [Thiovibrio frasassiensis]
MNRATFPKPVILVLLLAVAVRLYGTSVAPTINIDGTLYINQAKALYFGQWQELFCGLNFLPLNSLLLVPLYFVTQNWIVAAKTLSFVCGVGTIIPIYLINRRFFEERISVAILLLLSLIPVFVNSSVEIIKDPVAWVLFSWGLLCFIRFMEKNSRRDLLLCSILLLGAGWARAEFFLLYFATAIFLLISQEKHRIRYLLLFLTPLLPLSLLAFGNLDFFGVPPGHIRTPGAFAPQATEQIGNAYTTLKEQLNALAATYPPSGASLQNFLPEAANLAWLVGLGMIATRTCEAILHPFAIFFLIGFCSKGLWTHDKKIRYLLWITSIAFLIIYLQTLRTWVLEPRWLGGMILTATIFAGFGIQKTDIFLQERFKMTRRTSIVAICSFLLLFGLAKNMSYPSTANASYKEIATTIEKDSHESAIHLAGSASTKAPLYLVSFYANLNKPTAICPSDNLMLSEADLNSPATLSETLAKHSINYVLLAPAPPGPDHPVDRQQLTALGLCLGEWHHENLGPLVLYKVQ